MVYRCPACNSEKIYCEISVVAKRNMNTSKIYGVEKNNVDNEFTDRLYCESCGKADDWNKFEVEI